MCIRLSPSVPVGVLICVYPPVSACVRPCHVRVRPCPLVSTRLCSCPPMSACVRLCPARVCPCRLYPSVTVTKCRFGNDTDISGHQPTRNREHVTIDLERRSTTGSTAALQVEAPQLVVQPGQAYDQGSSSHVCIPIRWGRGTTRRELRVHFSRNPQVPCLRGPGLERGTGLLVRNFRPMLFGIPAIPFRVCSRNGKMCVIGGLIEK